MVLPYQRSHGEFWQTKDSGLSFYSGYAKINSYGNGKKCDF